MQGVAGNDLEDYSAGTYKVPNTIKEFAVTAPTEAAQATDLVVKSRTEVEVTFNATIKTAGAATLKWGANKAATASTIAKNSLKVTFTFTDAANIIPIGEQTFTVTGVADSYGNTVPNKTFTKTVEADAVATATVESETHQTFTVTFSKGMQNDLLTNGVKNKANYTVKDADGKDVAIDSVTYDAAKKKATVKTAAIMETGTYTVNISIL